MQLEHDVAIVWIDCDEIRDRSGAFVTRLFKRAFRVARRSAPSLIIFDGLDKLAPRDETSSEDNNMSSGNSDILKSKLCVEVLSDLAVSQQIASDAHMSRLYTARDSLKEHFDT